MKRLLVCLLVVAGASPPAFAQAAAAPTVAKPPLTKCAALAADWRRFEENMAMRMVDGLGDNSAPRATLRELEESNDLAMAAMTLQFMRDNRCPLPSRAPNAGTFLSAALDCSKARREASAPETPPACVRESWQAK